MSTETPELPPLGPEPEKWRRTEWLAWLRLRDRHRTANCAHRYDRPRWAGILGMRHDCSKCGDQYVDFRHSEDDGCEFHPAPEPEHVEPPPGWSPPDSTGRLIAVEEFGTGAAYPQVASEDPQVARGWLGRWLGRMFSNREEIN